jgi:cysteine synthase
VSYADLTATVGRTPLVELARIGRDLPARILAKLELCNPCGTSRIDSASP